MDDCFDWTRLMNCLFEGVFFGHILHKDIREAFQGHLRVGVKDMVSFGLGAGGEDY